MCVCCVAFDSYANTPEKGYGAKLRTSSDNLFDYLLEHGSLNHRIQDDSKAAGNEAKESDADAQFAEAVVQEEAGAAAHEEL